MEKHSGSSSKLSRDRQAIVQPTLAFATQARTGSYQAIDFIMMISHGWRSFLVVDFIFSPSRMLVQRRRIDMAL
jgi:hypothetical protein